MELAPDTSFATKPQLAQRMLARALDAGLPLAWVTGNTVYSHSTHGPAPLTGGPGTGPHVHGPVVTLAVGSGPPTSLRVHLQAVARPRFEAKLRDVVAVLKKGEL